MLPGLASLPARRNHETDAVVLAIDMIVAFAAVGTLFAAQTGDALKIQGDFKHWYLVHSTLITKDDNKLGLIAGVHLIYVNAAGLDRLKRGGSTPYPDGTTFSDDVRDFSAVDGVYM
jgi:hypothetical protein